MNLAYNGTDRFGRDNRFGFFPAVGLGYTISEEDFFSREYMQMLKVRVLTAWLDQMQHLVTDICTVRYMKWEEVIILGNPQRYDLEKVP